MSAHVIQKLLDVLPIDGSCMLVPAIAKASGLSKRDVSKGCIKLVSRGLVTRAEIGCYKLSEAGIAARAAGKKLTSGPMGAHTGVRVWTDTLSERLWRALRASQKATIPELLVLAAPSGAPSDREEELRRSDLARHYLNGLVAAGYVAKMARREPGSAATSNGFIKYFLVKNTGPKAPFVRRKRGVLYDPNNGESVPLKRAGAARAVAS